MKKKLDFKCVGTPSSPSTPMYQVIYLAPVTADERNTPSIMISNEMLLIEMIYSCYICTEGDRRWIVKDWIPHKPDK